jgi:glycosyltransferase involved in cell wall biosynthesis
LRLGAGVRAVIVTGPLVPEQTNVWAACAKLGVEIGIIGADPRLHRTDWLSRASVYEDIRLVHLKPLSPASARGHQLWMYRGLGRALRAIEPDVIHLDSEPWGGLPQQALFLNTLLRLNAVVCVQGADNVYWHGPPVEQMLRRTILGFVLPRIDGFVSWNRQGIQLAEEAGLPRSTPTRVLPGIVPSPDVFSPASSERRGQVRRRFGLPSDKVVIGFVGRLVEEKGVVDLIEAFGRAPTGGAFLVVWGSGPLRDMVHGAFASGRVPGRYGGALDRLEVADAFRAVDVVVVPSRSTPQGAEQFGRVAVEAMFSGCPVVAYATGSMGDVVADGGLLVQEGDVPGLSDALGSLIADDSLRTGLARHGRDRALGRFHPAIVAGEMIDLWRQLLSRRYRARADGHAFRTDRDRLG